MHGNPDSSPSATRAVLKDVAARCRWEAFRGPGPGGQKRNKTSSAVRVVHEPTGIAAIATESRSQSKNRAVATERVRHKLVMEVREAVDPAAFAPPTWFRKLGGEARLKLSRKSELYLPAIGLVLDVLEATGWSVSEAAELLDISTGNLVSFLAEDEKLWGKVNQMRTAAGLRPLAHNT